MLCVVPGGSEWWDAWPKERGIGKALSGSTFLLPGLFPIHSYIQNIRYASPSFVSNWDLTVFLQSMVVVFAVTWWHSVINPCSLMSHLCVGTSMRCRQIAPVLKLLSQASTFWFLSVLPRTVVSKSYHCKWKSAQLSFIFLWQMGKEDTKMRLFAKSPTGSRSRKELLSPISVWCWAHLPPQRAWRNLANCDFQIYFHIWKLMRL